MAVALVADRLIERDRLAGVLLDFQHLFRRDIHFLGEFLRSGLAAEVLEKFTLDTTEFVDDLDHVHRDADRAGLVGHGTGDRLPDPPGRVRREFVTLGVVELLDRADQAEVAFLDEVQESHAATGVPLGQRDDQTEIGLQQMVFRAFAVPADPLHIAALLHRELLAALSHLGDLLGRVEAGLDPLGQLHLFLGVE